MTPHAAQAETSAFATLKAILLACACILLPPALHAGESPVLKADHVRVKLLSGTRELVAGQTLTVGLHFEIDEHWHLYWTNPGDSGMEPKVKWRLPEGFEASPLRWPTPKRLPVAHLMGFGYEHELVLLADITVPPELAAGSRVDLKAQLSWLVCRVDCLAGEGDLLLRLPVAEAATPDPDSQAVFSRGRARLPAPAGGAGWSGGFNREPAGVHVVLRHRDSSVRLGPEAFFFPESAGWLHDAGRQRMVAAEGKFHLLLPLDEEPVREPPSESLRGILEVGLADPAAQGLEFELPRDNELASWQSIQPAEEQSALALLFAMLGAFVGGLILNLMPCVLPILSLKVLSLARLAEREDRSALQHALAFAAGVVASFWVVAGLLIALRKLGHELGWGFQLQSPLFVIALAGLFTILAANLFGAFEINLPLGLSSGEGRHGLSAAFASGGLATLVATPCTAPFMGAALGVALTGSSLRALLIFTALGLGMAIPYVVLTASPRLLSLIPTPGPWMESLKQLLGFALLATVAWLAWVFGQQADASGEVVGVNGLATLLVGLLVVGLGVWTLGRLSTPASSARRRYAGRALCVLLVLAGLVLPYRAVSADERGPEWKAYSAELIRELEQSGQPYFIDFTASWCLSCQVNKAVALNRADVREAFEERGVVAVMADWTNKDEDIAAALAHYDRVSVPLYVYETGGENGQTKILPNLLTESVVLQALEPPTP